MADSEPAATITAWTLHAPLGPDWTDRTTQTYQWKDERVRLTITRIPMKEVREPDIATMLDKREAKFTPDPQDKTLFKRVFEIGYRYAGELGVLTVLGSNRFVSYNLVVRETNGSLYDCVMLGPEEHRSTIEKTWRNFVDGCTIR